MTYEKVFHTGLTSGVFQFESHGMRDVLRRYKPTCVEDLTALNSLYRPGPIQGGMIEDFIERKWGRKKIEYELPELEPLLKETFGVIVYQEQVMQIANRLAGYSLGEADLLRRAMGKKDPEAMAKQRERFVRGAVERGFPPKKIEKLFDLMEQFAGYGFNKSHSAAYALLAYQTAYLKTHYPVEFMAALLTSVSGSTDDVVKYINECREMGIAVEPPDINVSDAYFTPHGEAIRFGLAAVKNVGHNAIESIVAARKDGGQVHVDLPVLRESRSAPAEQAGDRVADQERRHGFAGPPRATDGRGRQCHGARREDTERRGAGTARAVWRLPAGRRSAGTKSHCPTLPTGTSTSGWRIEKEILGFFITGHPLEKYREKLLDFSALTTNEVAALKSSTGRDEILIGGMLTNIRVAKSKKGDLYAQGQLEDMNGSVDILCFADNYKRLADKLRLTVPVLVKGGVRVEEGSNSKLMIGDITPLEEAKPKLPNHLRIKVPLENVSPATDRRASRALPGAQRRGPRALRPGAQRRLHRGDGG